MEVKSDEPDVRALAGALGALVRVVALAFAVFQLWTAAPFGRMFPDLIQRSLHLGFAFVLCFLLYPARPGRSPRHRPSLADALLAAVSVAGFAYIVVHYAWVVENPSESTPAARALGVLVTLATLEAARRTIGATFTLLAAIAVAYAGLGGAIPGVWGHTGFDARTILETLYLSGQGILGSVTGVSATLVAIFLIFGAVLYHTGGGETFVDLAKLIAGRSYGGPAKVSVFSSAFFGTISGSAVANVVVDGIFNIPLMKKMGYRSEFAAAVEATASSGGQIMPPVMGAGAFIMAELLGVPYVQIAIAAALPAILYYLGCGAAIHFEAQRRDLPTIPASLIPRARDVFAWRRSAALFVPVAILSYFLLQDYTPATSTFWSIVAAAAIFLLASTSWADLAARGRSLVAALEAGARSVVLVATLVAGAQIIIGMLNLTGVGVKFSELIVGASAQNLLLSLFFGMVVCLVLGMGLPTTAAYVLAASVVAPALTSLGVRPLAAHLFVFYFAIISAITPPVCAAVYVAAAIARADWVRTAFIAVQLGLAGFVVPYMFVYSPALLWQGPALEVAWASLTACIGVVALAGGSVGYLVAPATLVERGLLIVAAMLLIKPGIYTDVAGVACLLAVLAIQRRRAARRGKLSESPGAPTAGAGREMMTP